VSQEADVLQRATNKVKAHIEEHDARVDVALVVVHVTRPDGSTMADWSISMREGQPTTAEVRGVLQDALNRIPG
jgi:hypothetical protein